MSDGLQEPTLENLMEWETQAGCYTACEHDCWVEPDGHCPECGTPSWLIVLGFI